MSPARSRRVLWLGLLLLAPVPFFAIETGLVPVIRLWMLGSLVTGVMLQDPDYLSQTFTAMFVGQAALWTLVLYLVARACVRWLPPRAPAVVLALLALASLFPIYSTPFSAIAARSSILQIFG